MNVYSLILLPSAIPPPSPLFPSPNLIVLHDHLHTTVFLLTRNVTCSNVCNKRLLSLIWSWQQGLLLPSPKTRPSKNQKGGSGKYVGVEVSSAPGIQAHFRLAFDLHSDVRLLEMLTIFALCFVFESYKTKLVRLERWFFRKFYWQWKVQELIMLFVKWKVPFKYLCNVVQMFRHTNLMLTINI